MKRKLLALFVASSCLIGNLFAQDSEYAVGTTIGGTVDDVSRFSLGIKGGLNYLRISDQKVQPAGGAFMEITVNPLWGLGLEYMYLKNNRDATSLSGGFDLESTVQDITLYGSLNVSNIIAKYRSHGWQKWNLYANAGAGVSIYDWELENGSSDNGVVPVAVAGLGLEFNAAKWLALGLEGQYRLHANGDFVGRGNGGRSSMGANFVARFKLGGDKNVRNITLLNYDPQVEVFPPVDQAALDKQFADATEKLEKQVAAQNAEIQKVNSQVKELQDTLAAMKKRARAAVKYTPTQEEARIIQTAFSTLEFESGKDVIKPSSFSSLDGLADLLKQRPEWSVILRGYTDSSGNAEKNLQLSKDRAYAVKAYLVNRGVSASAIQTFGHGAADPIASNSTAEGRAKNRRVEIELFSKE